jgi:hypothetical protein
MAKRILFLGFVIAVSAFAHAAPGVWEQMEHGATTSSIGVVKAVDILGSEIYIKVETKDAFGDPTVRHDRLCSLKDGIDPQESEEMRAVLFRAKLDVLQEARRNGKPIEYGTRGVWNSCVSFLRVLEG